MEAAVVRTLAKLAAITVALALTGCGLVRSREISHMDSTQITQVSARDLCNPNVSGSVAEQERARRGLGDCSPAHFQCVKTGFQPGTDSYLRCRNLAAQQDIANRSMYLQMIPMGAQMMSQPRPTVTTGTCQSVGATVFCNGVSQ